MKKFQDPEGFGEVEWALLDNIVGTVICYIEMKDDELNSTEL